MTIELNGRKVVVTGGKLEFDRTIADLDMGVEVRRHELKRLLPKIEAHVASQPPNGTSSQTSLWRQ